MWQWSVICQSEAQNSMALGMKMQLPVKGCVTAGELGDELLQEWRLSRMLPLRKPSRHGEQGVLPPVKEHHGGLAALLSLSGQERPCCDGSAGANLHNTSLLLLPWPRVHCSGRGKIMAGRHVLQGEHHSSGRGALTFGGVCLCGT